MVFTLSSIYSQDSSWNSDSGNPGENYLEMAIHYINERNHEAAQRYLSLAMDSADEDVYQKSIIWSLYLKALKGEKNIESQINQLLEDSLPQAHYYLADGWQSYYEKNPEASDIYQLSIEYKEKLIARYPETDWAVQASLQLVPVFMNKKNYDKALVYLLKYIRYMNENPDGRHIYPDKAWFYMGHVLENSTDYRDLHKAILSYQKVMEDENSLFYDQAKERIESIEKFYYMSP